MKINSSFPDWFEEFLLSSGLSKKVVACSCLDTRFYHDLNIYGDHADPLIEELERRIDMSSFVPNRYFPPEFPGQNFISNMLYNTIPFFHQLFGLKDKYSPLTFADVLNALERGAWIEIRND